MKFRLTILFFIFGLCLSAQVDFTSIEGDWKVKTLSLNGKIQKTENISIIISNTDLGDYFLEQTYYDSETGACSWSILLEPKGGNKILHDLLIDEPGCKCNLLGEYSYELKNGMLTISNSKNKMELVKKS